MIITKTYEVGITGKYQPRKFVTTLSEEFPPLNTEDILSTGSYLFQVCVQSVIADMKVIADTDPDFVLIQAAAKEELNKYAIYLANIAKRKENEKGTQS